MDGTGRIWDASTGEPALPPLPHFGMATYGAYLPDGNRFITTSGDGFLHVWNSVDAQEQFSLRHTNRFYMAGYSGDGTRLLTVTVDGTAGSGTPRMVNSYLRRIRERRRAVGRNSTRMEPGYSPADASNPGAFWT